MGDGRHDTQRVWHEYVGAMLRGKSILDVGAGLGLSKERLSRGGNTVTTQDIDRSLMTGVDIIAELRDMHGKWDVLTAFDVIEHVVEPARFLVWMSERARESVFVSTPNHALYPHPWHFAPAGLVSLFGVVGGRPRYFLRHRSGDDDRIEEVGGGRFLEDHGAYALGILATWDTP